MLLPSWSRDHMLIFSHQFTSANVSSEYVAVGVEFFLPEEDLEAQNISVELRSTVDPDLVVRSTSPPYGVAICPLQFVPVRFHLKSGNLLEAGIV